MIGVAPARGWAGGSATPGGSAGRAMRISAPTAATTTKPASIHVLELRIMPIDQSPVPSVHDPPARAVVPLHPPVAEEHVHPDRPAGFVQLVIVLHDVSDAVAGRQSIGREHAIGCQPAIVGIIDRP